MEKDKEENMKPNLGETLEIARILLKNVPRTAPRIMWTCRAHSCLTNVGF